MIGIKNTGVHDDNDRDDRDDDTIVNRVDDLGYFDECQKCEGGMVLNPSATKGHKYNGKKEEEI